MRDFSGKGSLWCINPDVKSALTDQLMKASDHDRCSIPLLCDISETPKPSINNYLKTFKSRMSNKTASTPFLNPKLVTKVATSLAPPKITNIIKIQPQSKPSGGAKLSVQNESSSQTSANPVSPSQDLDDVSEMDAVKALLSMKSRASAVAVKLYERQDEKNAMDYRTVRPGRRKQLFKPPMKKSFVQFYDEEEDDDDQEINDFSDDDDLIDDDCNESKQDQDDPSFDHDSSNKEEILSDLSDKDEEFDSKLQIDESFNSDEEDPFVEPLSKKQKIISPIEEEKETKAKSHNALLELSRAASLLEDKQESDRPRASTTRSHFKKSMFESKKKPIINPLIALKYQQKHEDITKS